MNSLTGIAGGFFGLGLHRVRRAFVLTGALGLGILSSVSIALASANLPDCVDENRQPMQIDNDAVLRLKEKSRNGHQARAYVEGPITRIFPDRNDHTHFEISIGSGKDDVLEVVYNDHFGPIPELRVGMRVGACGDYITSIAQNGPYPASPSGAIIHWVHENTRGGGQPSGFLTFEGDLYGYPSLTGHWGPPRRGDGGRGRGNGRGGRGGRNGFLEEFFEFPGIAAEGAAL